MLLNQSDNCGDCPLSRGIELSPIVQLFHDYINKYAAEISPSEWIVQKKSIQNKGSSLGALYGDAGALTWQWMFLSGIHH